MLYFIDTIRQSFGLYPPLYINPQSNFGSIQWGLLNDGQSTIRTFCMKRLKIIGLIGSIAHEETLEHRHGSFQFSIQQGLIGLQQGIYLFGIC